MNRPSVTSFISSSVGMYAHKMDDYEIGTSESKKCFYNFVCPSVGLSKCLYLNKVCKF